MKEVIKILQKKRKYYQNLIDNKAFCNIARCSQKIAEITRAINILKEHK